MFKPDLSFLRNPKVAVPVIAVGIAAGWYLTKRSGGAAASEAESPGSAQAPVEDPLAGAVTPGTSGPGPSGPGTSPGNPGDDTAPPVDQGDGGAAGGFVRAPTPPRAPAVAITPQATAPIAGPVPGIGTRITEAPPGSIYGAAGYFGNGNGAGYSDSAIEEGANVMLALGAPQANARIPINDRAGNPQTVLRDAINPNPGVVNAGNGESLAQPGTTASAQLINMLQNATPVQLASQEWRDTWNSLNQDDGGTARI